MTLISAPPGYGKTSLAVEWLQSGQLAYAWLALDEGDNYPARFLVYLIAALQAADEALSAEAHALPTTCPSKRMVFYELHSVFTCF